MRETRGEKHKAVQIAVFPIFLSLIVGQVKNTSFGRNISNETVLNNVKCQVLSFLGY